MKNRQFQCLWTAVLVGLHFKPGGIWFDTDPQQMQECRNDGQLLSTRATIEHQNYKSYIVTRHKDAYLKISRILECAFQNTAFFLQKIVFMYNDAPARLRYMVIQPMMRVFSYFGTLGKQLK